MGFKYEHVPDEKHAWVKARKRYVAAQLQGIAGRLRTLPLSHRRILMHRAAHDDIRAILSKLADGIEAEAAKLTT